MGIEIMRSRLPAELRPSDAGAKLIRHFESFRPVAYLCPAGVWTIGYGFTKGVTQGQTMTIAEADARLAEELESYAEILRRQIPDVPLTQGQFDALVSYVYNLGRLLETLLAKLQARDYAGALLEFPRACRAGGKPMRGLYRRRLAEACIWSGLPWESACSVNLIKLKSDDFGNIDWAETTTLESTLERARLDAAAPKFEMPWPIKWPETIVIEPAPLPVPEPEAIPAPVPEPVIETPVIVEEPPPMPPPPPAPPEPSPVIPPYTPPAPPLPPPPPPPVIPPERRQREAVSMASSGPDADWSGAKAMILSRRFWGLWLIIFGRLWITWTGSTTLLTAASDPIVAELLAGFIVMCAGEALQKWGSVKATRPLK